MRMYIIPALGILATLMILWASWKLKGDKDSITVGQRPVWKSPSDFAGIPTILRIAEHPKATAHYDNGPHENCPCRVCTLQRKVEFLDLETVRMLNEGLKDAREGRTRSLEEIRKELRDKYTGKQQ